MLNRFFLILVSFLFFSCATITLKGTYKLKVKSDIASKIQYHDSTYNLPTEIEVYRSPNPLRFIYIVDTLRIKISIESKLNPTYKYGNIICFPSGFMVDLLSDKRFYYGKILILNPNGVQLDSKKLQLESSKIQSTYNPNQLVKKFVTEVSKFHLSYSIPTACNFYMQPIGQGIKKSVGFGFTFGLDYNYKKNKFISFNVASFVDRFGQFNYSLEDDFSEYERQASDNFSLSDNFKFNRFTLGYGINFSQSNWSYNSVARIDDYFIKTTKLQYNQNFGFVFTGYFQVFKHFLVGVHYRPSILEVAPSTKFSYQHIFGLDYQLKF